MTYLEAACLGRLGNPPVRRTSKAGKLYATLSLAVQGRDEGGPTWVNVTLFPPLLDELPELVKGERCYCEGALALRSWEKDGEMRASLQLTARTFLALDRIGRRRRKSKAKAGDDWQAPHPIEGSVSQ